MTVITLILLVLFIALGRWQWGRAEFKQRLGAEFASGAGEIVALGSKTAVELPRYAYVEVSGGWDDARQFLLDNRTRDGRAGYEVLTPLQLENGRWLLVNRGWVPFEGYRERLPDVGLSSSDGAVTIVGRLDELPTAGLAGGRAAPAISGGWPRVTAYPLPEELARSLGVDPERLESRVLLLDASEPEGYRRDWKPYAKGPEQNWSYAIQWWSFAVLLLVLFVVMNLKKEMRNDD